MPEPELKQGGGAVRAPLGSALVLSVTVVLSLIAFAIPAAMIVVPRVYLPPPLIPHNQHAESLVFVLGFFVVLPLCAWLGPLLTDRIARRRGPEGATVVATLLAVGFACTIAFLKISGHLPWGDSIHVAAAVLAAWLVIAAALLMLASSGKSAGQLARLKSEISALWVLAGLAGVVCLLAIVHWPHVEAAPLVAGLAVAGLVTFLVSRYRIPRVSKRWGRVIDITVFVLVVLLAIDMVIFETAAGTSDIQRYNTYVIQFHQNLFLGPLSQIMHGKVLLVDTVSQYGVGSIYLIAAWFLVAPIGHGTLGFFDGALSAIVIASGYLIMRLAGVRRPVAIPAMAIAVVVLAWGVTYPLGGLLQHGAIRYGIPVLVIIPLLAAFKWPRFGRSLRIVALFFLGLSSIWALEAFLYAAATWVAMVGMEVTWQPRDGRVSWLLRRAAEGVAAFVVVQVLFALATVIASGGDLPDWNLYITYLRDFLFGSIGDLTYDYGPWSRGLGVGAFYLAATIGVVLMVWRKPGYVRANKPAFLALAGSLGYGISLYSYFVNRSLDHILIYLLLPFVVFIAIVLSLLLREDSPAPRRLALSALAVTLGVSAFWVSVAAPQVKTRASDSLLAYIIPGGPSLSSGFHRLWNPPPLVPGSDVGEAMLTKYMPDEDTSAVLAEPDLSTEILVRSQRANSLGFTDPKENNWVPGPSQPVIDKAVSELRNGDRILMDSNALEIFRKLRKDPNADLKTVSEASHMTGQQGGALLRIGSRFDLRKLAFEPEVPADPATKLEVVELVPRTSDDSGHGKREGG